ncbi:MAG: peptidoglycan-binding protein [Myxococcota bacterium]|nr:peptidoglycan-binding protein [Myxococcota bacterium]
MNRISENTRYVNDYRPAPATGALNFGSRGQDVREVQRHLRSRGYNLAEDGIYGRGTVSAVKDFQRKNGLAPDGIAGSQTTSALRSSVPGGSGLVGRTPSAVMNHYRNHPQATERLQRILNARGYAVQVNGRMGPQTIEAVKAFQREHGLVPDGIAGPQTINALNRTRAGAAPDVSRTTNNRNHVTNRWGPNAGPPNGVAQIESYRSRGQRHQMAIGKITVNGKVYNFRSGGGGRGNLPPGDYTIRPHLWSRSDKASMMVDGVGYSFAMSNKYDPRVGGTRTLLRIHPDGQGPGTIGCIGIVGNGAVQRAFREDMRAELARNGGQYTLRVRP